MVKIYGAGGLRGLEAYQSGFFASPEGHILTALSLVLDRNEVTVVLSDGRKLKGKVVGSDPVAEIAVLKVDLNGEQVEYFNFDSADIAEPGVRVLALSNLFNIATGNEPVSVLHGSITAVAPLDARRGAFATRFTGDVLILDASTNNPGAAGGVLVSQTGQPLGMLGKEIRSRVTGTWLHYALPAEEVAERYRAILEGRIIESDPDDLLPEQPASLAAIGLRLVPSVLPRTPPYVDGLQRRSASEDAGLQPDDLLLAIDGATTGSVAEVAELLARIEAGSTIVVTILRGQEVIDIELVVPEAAK
jgi:serine protease Do